LPIVGYFSIFVGVKCAYGRFAFENFPGTNNLKPPSWTNLQQGLLPCAASDIGRNPGVNTGSFWLHLQYV